MKNRLENSALAERRRLPEGWEWCEILEVAAKTKYPIGDGDHGQIKPSMYTNSGIPYIRVADISKGEIKKEKLVYISKDIHEKNLKSELHPDDIIISKTGATIGKVAIIPYEIPLANTTSSVGKITLDQNKMIPKFLFYFMNTSFFQNQMWSVSFKSAQPGFNIINLKKFKILVSPLSTQRRIVSILEKAEETKTFRAQADELTDRLLQSVFKEMFGDPVRNPKGWEIKRLDHISEIVSGVTKGRKLSDNSIVSVPYLRVANVQDGFLDLKELKTIDALPSEIEKFALLEGDILLTEGGDPDKLGRGAVWHHNIPNCIHQNHIFRVRVDIKSIAPEFLSMLIGSAYGKMYFLKSAKQTTGIATINSTQLKNFPVLVPPFELQSKFEFIVEKIETMRQSQNQSKQQIEDLFGVLMQKAFRGEI